MCVTSSPAIIEATRTSVYRTRQPDADSFPVDICFYQNESRPFGPRIGQNAGPNCMFLNFAGRNLGVVRGPELTSSLMDDLTRGLPQLEDVYLMRGMTKGPVSFGGGVQVVSYGDYTVVLAQGPADILDALDQVPQDRRPTRTQALEEFVNFYMSFYPTHSFVLACFNTAVQPRHPIAVRYEPNDPSVLTIPGLDGHDGRLPVVGAPVHRDFKVAFAIDGVDLPHKVNYRDTVANKPWAPSSVAGFVDNREVGPNGDYVVPIEAVRDGLTGRELAAVLR